MPELPEVETVKNSLNELIINKKIKSVKVFYERIIQNILVSDFESQLINERFIKIDRVGKYLVFLLERHILLAHLRMEGKYLLRGLEEKGKHEHVIFYLENDETLRYVDTRKFGVIYSFNNTSIEEILKKEPLCRLGVEPLKNALTEDYLMSKFKKINKPLKTVLLDQTIISGLGNIYADEVCFMSQIHPCERVNTLDYNDVKKICINSQIVLEKAISLGGTTIRSFMSSHEITGRFQNELLIHTKTNCPVCNKKVEKIYVNGRGTYYCKNCQKHKNFKIGITGSIACGKSIITKHFSSLGYNTISCDDLVHDLLENDEEVKRKIVNSFSESILTNNKIDRTKLSKIVFNSKKNKYLLESIIHPIVKKVIEKLEGIWVVEVPLLYEAKMEKLFDVVITVYASIDTQMERLTRRNNISTCEAVNLINNQMDLNEKVSRADYVIINDNDSDYKKQIEIILDKIK